MRLTLVSFRYATSIPGTVDNEKYKSSLTLDAPDVPVWASIPNSTDTWVEKVDLKYQYLY